MSGEIYKHIEQMTNLTIDELRQGDNEVSRYVMPVMDAYNAAVKLGDGFIESREFYLNDDDLCDEFCNSTITRAFIKASMVCAADPDKAAEIAAEIPVRKINVIEVARRMTLQGVAA